MEGRRGALLRASVWREFAEHVAGSLTKGSRVIATGRLKQRSYQDREGNNRTSIELEVDEIGPSLRYATARSPVPPVAAGVAGQRAQVQQSNDEPWSTPARTTAAATAALTRGALLVPTETTPRSDLRPALERDDRPLEIPDAMPGPRGRPGIRTTRKKEAWLERPWRPPQAAEGREERRPREGDPRRRHRLQGRRNPPQVHLGAREDPRPSYHGVSVQEQPLIARAIKNAREMALLPTPAPAAKEHRWQS